MKVSPESLSWTLSLSISMKLFCEKIGLKAGEKVKIYFKILSNEGIELERIPGNGSIEVTIPDDAAIFKLWDV